MIAFRLDANEQVATGHLFRCMAVAKKCRQKGENCVFLLAEEKCTEIIQKEGFPFEVLNIKWDDWDYGTDRIREALLRWGAKCLVVDSYRVTTGFFEGLYEGIPIFYLDDLCVKTYKVSATLHYSEWDAEHIIEDLYQGTNVKVYAGMQYMPLRENFEQEEKEMPKYDLLITTGGSDTYHITLGILKRILSNPTFQDSKICAVLGKMNSDVAKITELAREHANIEIMQNISNMAEVMRQSRFAITAGGTSVYELMACKVCFVCFGFSDDQVYFGERLKQHRNALWAGDARASVESVLSNLERAVLDMFQMDERNRQEIITKNRQMIDGKGAERIADIVIGLCE